MHIRDLSGKKICILGFGKEGKAMLAALDALVTDAAITIADRRSQIHCASCGWQMGDQYLDDLNRFDIIIKSPGIPPNPQLAAHSSQLSSGTQIFLDTIANTGATVIGVTGSKGKSTTSTLIYEILKAAGKDVHLIGNIGKPAIEYIDQARKGTIFIMEMSSYQLMDLTVSPHIAVVTSFFPEHLDYHGSLEAYKEAKKHITRFQKRDDVVFYNDVSDGAKEIAEESVGKKIPFTAKDCLVAITDTHLIGEHNLSNMAAACKVATELGIEKKIVIDVLRSFRGLPHRLQSLGVHHDIEWVDDAISTTPESTIAALDALGDRVSTIIVGGQDRGNDFTELGKRIAQSQIQTVICIGESGERIRAAIEQAAKALTPGPSPVSGRGENDDKEKVKKGIDSIKYPPKAVVHHAREMRREPTKAEALLWKHLRNYQLNDLYFRRQRPIGNYIADFYCESANLVIELDGSFHNTKEQREYDEDRTGNLEGIGARVIRFRNEEVLENPKKVLQEISVCAQQSSPLPLTGEGPGVRAVSPHGRGAGGEGCFRELSFHPASFMEQVVELAKKHTPPRTICLLSTASPSYDMFKNFEEKGDSFRKCIGDGNMLQ